MSNDTPAEASTSDAGSLEDKLQELEFLQRLDRELSWMLDLNYVLDITLDWAIRRSAADAGLIARKQGDNLHIVRVTGHAYRHAAELMREPWPASVGTIGWVAETGKPFYMPYVTLTSDPHLIYEHTRSKLTIPLSVKDRVIGVLHLESRHPAHFRQDMRTFISHVANRASIALNNAELYTRTYNAEQLKSDMIRMAAHDLRNPLSTITTAVHLIERMKDKLPDSIQNIFGNIAGAAKQMDLLIDELLTLERIEAAAAAPKPVDLVKSLQDAMERVIPESEQKSHTLTVSLPNTAIIVLGELAYFRQAMLNLINNAIKYTQEGGKIIVRLEQMGNRAFFEVEDNGYGISREKQARLFERFYRANQPGTERIKGTGLGLSLVKTVIERAKGEVWFKSEEGKGSTFGFWLPTRVTGALELSDEQFPNPITPEANTTTPIETPPTAEAKSTPTDIPATS